MDKDRSVNKSNTEYVYLDALDGYTFEKLCGRIFRLHGYDVEDTPYSNDKGRDLILKKDNEKIFVECKFHQNSIGRPVIQKLDSAVRMYRADRGIVVTTSSFTPEAIEYADNLTPPIELKDKYALIDLAHQVGIEIFTTIKRENVECYVVSNLTQLQNKLQKIYDSFVSYPNKVQDVMTITHNGLELKSKYLVTYDIHADFYTTVRLIHSIHEDDCLALIDAETSIESSQSIMKFLKNATLCSENDIPKKEYSISRHQFRVSHTSLNGLVGNLIAKKYATNVKYYGRNNVGYSKLCIPHQKDFGITNIRQVLLPLHYVVWSSINQQYRCTFIENDSTIDIQDTDVFTCKICNKKIKKALLCNDCGNISHAPTFFKSHSSFCNNCKKTICKNCNHTVRRFLFFKKPMCSSCNVNAVSRIGK